MTDEEEGYDIALIGFGNRGKYYLQRFHPDRYGADLSGYADTMHVVDPVETRRAEALDFEHGDTTVFVYEDAGEVAEEDIDIAIDASNYPRRIENLKPFIETGSAVLSEKPLSRDLEDSRELAELAGYNGVISAVGLNMNQTPAYLDAIEYLEENNVAVTGIYIDWFKNRGPRDHPVVEGILTEIPHQAGLIYPIMREKPDRVSIGETDFRRSPAVLNPEKYGALPEEEKERIEFCEDIDIGEGDQHTYWMLTELNTGISWQSSESTIANIRNSWTTGEEIRTLRISGYEGDIEEGYFNRIATTGVDFTSEGKEKAFWVRKGLKNGDPRDKEGELIAERAAEYYGQEYDSTDTLDLQLRKFFESVKYGELHEDLVSFEEGLDVEEMVREIEKEYMNVAE
ncbi:MAG: Gfo/Idh/MocA family oxidoreductase [Candidatus Nanohaloarchaea archaeon]|nr:Gfo/Idh/MocA family oxidoreductase [Candidatus Nanohaloarchaea archaeon]